MTPKISSQLPPTIVAKDAGTHVSAEKLTKLKKQLKEAGLPADKLDKLQKLTQKVVTEEDDEPINIDHELQEWLNEIEGSEQLMKTASHLKALLSNDELA